MILTPAHRVETLILRPTTGRGSLSFGDGDAELKVALAPFFQGEKSNHDTLTAYKTTPQTLTATFTPITAYDGTHVAASGNLSWSAANGDANVGKAGRFWVSYSVSTRARVGADAT